MTGSFDQATGLKLLVHTPDENADGQPTILTHVIAYGLGLYFATHDPCTNRLQIGHLRRFKHASGAGGQMAGMSLSMYTAPKVKKGELLTRKQEYDMQA